VIELSDTIARNPDAFSRTIQDMQIVLQSRTSELHSFNPVAARVWELIDGTRTAGEIVDAVVDQYDVDRETARTDVLELLERLADKQLVVVA
jgi:pyrroloquinoline quinone biosynthesis protein D